MSLFRLTRVMPLYLLCGGLTAGLALSSIATAEEPAAAAAKQPPAAKPAESVEQLVDRVRKSVVVISFTGRDGQQQGLGSGFVVSADGLIATNFHVLGEGRPVSVQLADGRQFDITSVHASDRALDLAIVRIDARDLPTLSLGDSSSLRQGQTVIALGHPRGLSNSVVTGIVSGLREVEGRSLIQLAMPIESGNSGGPLVDLEGRVHGVLTLKSALTPNLGFAVAINTLKPLLEKPNPIPISRWLTIGALNPREWKPLFGAHWRRRAGHLFAAGAGDGFGGRTLCLYQQPLPELPYEVAVAVRLDDESGAAGLAFCSDGKHQHYGFYPTAGKLRLTQFAGADVFGWKVLYDQPSAFYRPGDWNLLRVRLEEGKLQAFVNDHLVVEHSDASIAAGQVGLAKFRSTQAQFKAFKVGKDLRVADASAEEVALIRGKIDQLAPGWPGVEVVESLGANSTSSVSVLRDRARSLEQQAEQLRQLAVAVHSRKVIGQLVTALEGDEEKIDLAHAALLVARLDNDELDVESYRQELARMAQEVRATLPQEPDDEAKLAALGKYLFSENGFHGSRHDYYNRSNSYLNEVLDDREGLPITLSILYMDLARRLGVKVVGVGLPGHFVVRHVARQGEDRLIDVYEGAKPLAREDAARKVLDLAGREITEQDLTAASSRAVIARMLHNLLSVATDGRDVPAMLRYLDALVAVDPNSATDRLLRAQLSAIADRKQVAREDFDWLLEKKPPGLDLELVRQLRQSLEAGVAPVKAESPAAK